MVREIIRTKSVLPPQGRDPWNYNLLRTSGEIMQCMIESEIRSLLPGCEGESLLSLGGSIWNISGDSPTILVRKGRLHDACREAKDELRQDERMIIVRLEPGGDEHIISKTDEDNKYHVTIRFREAVGDISRVDFNVSFPELQITDLEDGVCHLK